MALPVQLCGSNWLALFFPNFSRLYEVLWPNVPQSAHFLAKIIFCYFNLQAFDQVFIYSGRPTHSSDLLSLAEYEYIFLEASAH